MPDLFGDNVYGRVRRSAEISECGRYRWWLRRAWTAGGDGRVVCFVMLNPSTANAQQDDPTLRKCMGYTQRWGFSVLSVRNLFAYRATDPAELLAIDFVTATGGERGDVELAVAKTADLVVCAGARASPATPKTTVAFATCWNCSPASHSTAWS
jgi:hypothetical protein